MSRQNLCLTVTKHDAVFSFFKGQLKWKNILDKYVYLLTQYTKQHFL